MRPNAAKSVRAWILALLGLLVIVEDSPGQATPGRVSSPRNPAVSRRMLEALYRPTVTILKGNARGSGTVVASYPGETLILTAAHVVEPEGDLSVELQPYNLGVETNPEQLADPWPRRLPGELAARDRAGDVAVVRVRGRMTLPYVARIAPVDVEPNRDELLTSVGVDGTNPLTGWHTDVLGVPRLDIGKGGVSRFILTNRAPEHGRSGGGLFRPDGTIVGVCVGRIEPKQPDQTATGVFASIETIRALLSASGLDQRIQHSEAYRRLSPNRTRVAPPAPGRGRE